MRDYLFFKTGKFYCKIKFSDILYLQAEKKLVNVVTSTKAYLVLNSFKEVEKYLPRPVFCRIHRSYVISLDHTDKFDGEFVYIGNKKIPISERYRAVLKNAMVILTCHEGPFKLDNGDVDKLLNDLNP